MRGSSALAGVRVRGALLRRARRARRGLTVYIVLLVISMLSAVGIFASRAASLSIAQSGYFRQMMQTHYVTEYAVHATLATIATDAPGYVAEIEQQSADVTDALTGWRACRTGGLNTRCYKFTVGAVEDRLLDGDPLLAAPTEIDAARPLKAPGSLGRADITSSFLVEVTDLAQIASNIEGERATDMQVAFYSAVLSATGEVGPPVGDAASTAEKLRSSAMSMESARAQITLGPLPAR